MGKKNGKKGRRKLEKKIEKLGHKLQKSVRKRAALTGEASARVMAADTVQGVWISPESAPAWGPGPGAVPDVASLMEMIRSRRSIKRFTGQAVSKADIEKLLEAATLAPNHRMTEPWRFYVLGPRARRAYGDALGARKARKLEDADAAAQVAAKVARENEALPAVIAVAMKASEDAEQLREDFAATFMGVQNLCLAANALGLGTHIKTGAIMDDPAAREAAGVADDERIIAIINLGWPAEVPSPKRRREASEMTVWRD